MRGSGGQSSGIIVDSQKAELIVARGYSVVALVLTGCSFASPHAAVGPSPLHGRLESGTYDVGVAAIFTRDTSRPALTLDSAPTDERGRPMQIVVWYPATKAAGLPMTLREYVRLSAGVVTASPTSGQMGQVVEEFASSVIRNGKSRSAVDSILDLPMQGVSGSPVARGRFPLVIFLHASPWRASVMSEYLASHGYVVASIESKGATEVPYRLSKPNLDAMVLDAAFTAGRMQQELYVGDAVGVIGMSNGSIAAVALQTSGITPKAIVSLDGGIGERAGGSYLSQRTDSVVTKLTVPILHLYTPDNPNLDFQYLRSYEAANRILVRVGHVRHGDFIVPGAIEGILPGAFGPAPEESSVGFEWVNRYTLQFLQLHLRGDARAGGFLSASPESNGAPAALMDVEALPKRVNRAKR